MIHLLALGDIAGDTGRPGNLSLIVQDRGLDCFNPDAVPRGVYKRFFDVLALTQLHHLFVVGSIVFRQVARHKIEIGLADHFFGRATQGLGERFIGGDVSALCVFDPGQVGNVVEKRALLLLHLVQRIIHPLALRDVAGVDDDSPDGGILKKALTDPFKNSP